LKGSQAAAPAA